MYHHWFSFSSPESMRELIRAPYLIVAVTTLDVRALHLDFSFNVAKVYCLSFKRSGRTHIISPICVSKWDGLFVTTYRVVIDDVYFAFWDRNAPILYCWYFLICHFTKLNRNHVCRYFLLHVLQLNNFSFYKCLYFLLLNITILRQLTDDLVVYIVIWIIRLSHFF